MLNENEVRLNALVNELRAHVSDLSIRAATMAGELAVSQARIQLLEGAAEVHATGEDRCRSKPLTTR